METQFFFIDCILINNNNIQGWLEKMSGTFSSQTDLAQMEKEQLLPLDIGNQLGKQSSSVMKLKDLESHLITMRGRIQPERNRRDNQLEDA
jgi:hypothetical protein